MKELFRKYAWMAYRVFDHTQIVLGEKVYKNESLTLEGKNICYILLKRKSAGLGLPYLNWRIDRCPEFDQ